MDVFDWKKLGDVQKGRENLGGEMPVAVYRLLQYTMKDELTARFGEEVTDAVFRAAGHRAGMSFAVNNLDLSVGLMRLSPRFSRR